MFCLKNFVVETFKQARMTGPVTHWLISIRQCPIITNQRRDYVMLCNIYIPWRLQKVAGALKLCCPSKLLKKLLAEDFFSLALTFSVFCSSFPAFLTDAGTAEVGRITDFTKVNNKLAQPRQGCLGTPEDSIEAELHSFDLVRPEGKSLETRSAHN